MEIMGSPGSWFYFFAEAGRGEAAGDIILFIVFIVLPVLIYCPVSLAWRIFGGTVTVIPSPRRGKGGAARFLGLAPPVWPRVPEVQRDRVDAGAGETESSPDRRLVAISAARMVRNIFLCLAVLWTVLGISGLEERVIWRSTVTSGPWEAMPFELHGSLTLLLMIEPVRTEADKVTLSLSLDGGKTLSSVREVSLTRPGASDTVMTVTGPARPALRIRDSGRFRVTVVKDPEPVLGFLLLSALSLFIFSLAAVWGRRQALPYRNEVKNRLFSAVRVILPLVSVISGIVIFCSLWYIGIKLIDHFFRTGIWMTYDNFIQAILERILQ